jgi:hypothetical protein
MLCPNEEALVHNWQETEWANWMMESIPLRFTPEVLRASGRGGPLAAAWRAIAACASAGQNSVSWPLARGWLRRPSRGPSGAARLGNSNCKNLSMGGGAAPRKFELQESVNGEG